MIKKRISMIFVFVVSPSLADSGFLGELSLGQSNQKIDSPLVDDGYSNSYGVRGSYQFSDYFSLSLEYKEYGTAENKYKPPFNPLVWDIDTSSINFGARVSLPVFKEASIFAEAGHSDWDIKVLATNQNGNARFKDSGSDLYYRIGATYQIHEKVFSRAEYLTIDMGLPGGRHKVKNFSLSIGYRF